MPIEAVKKRYPLPVEHISMFVRNGIKPPIELSRVNTNLYSGKNEQARIPTPTTGNLTLLLGYKNYPVALVSWAAGDQDLLLLQLQGCRSEKSYRGSTAIDWVALFSHETIAIAAMPESGISRVTMPPVSAIEGISDISVTEQAIARYNIFLSLAMLTWSQEERQHVRDIR